MPPRSPSPLPTTCRALEHGTSAEGARDLRPGFARSAERDLAFALGWPHLRTLVQGHPDDALTDPAAIGAKVITSPTRALPEGIARRRVRAYQVLRVTGVGQWDAATDAAIADASPITESDVRGWLPAFLQRVGRRSGFQLSAVSF